MKRLTEALIMVTQEQAIRTNSIKTKIDKTQENVLYRICEGYNSCDWIPRNKTKGLKKMPK